MPISETHPFEPLVIFIDVDNTLLDNDLVRMRLEDRLETELGAANAARFWGIYEEVREGSGVVDFPMTIARFRSENQRIPNPARLEYLVFGFPFSEVVYGGAFAALGHAKQLGRPVILSDGDQCFQRHKIRAAGFEAAVDGHVLVFEHKELSLDRVRALYPAAHYVMIDDKPRILVSVKEQLQDDITTVMVCQGKYAHDPSHHDYPGADFTIEGIDGLIDLDTALLARRPQRQLPGRGPR